MKKYSFIAVLLCVTMSSCKKEKSSFKEPEKKSIIEAGPFDIQYDKYRGWLYLFETSGVITIYDVANDKVKEKISTGATIGYCDLADYNGVKELYVPRNDGWLFIYNASTLKLIDQISIGKPMSCVVQNNGILFVSTDAWTNSPLKVYSRSTKKMITENGDFEMTRFKKIPNTYTELLEITINVGPTDQDHYTFDGGGTFVSHDEDAYHGDYDLDADIFEFSPSGNKYITSRTGAIYTKNMKYETSLPRGNLWFTSFAFDDSSRFIYGGSHEKNVVVYDINTYHQMRSITTEGYPFRIFANRGQILCVSSIDPVSNGWGASNIPTKLILEHLK